MIILYNLLQNNPKLFLSKREITTEGGEEYRKICHSLEKTEMLFDMALTTLIENHKINKKN